MFVVLTLKRGVIHMPQAQTKEPKQKANTSSKIQPLGNNVLVKRLEQDEKVKGGIIIPDTAKKKQERGEVIAAGPGKKDKSGKLIPMPVKVGDIVLIQKYSGQEITWNDEEFVITKADDILAIVEK
jgi:chaperonin GroES